MGRTIPEEIFAPIVRHDHEHGRSAVIPELPVLLADSFGSYPLEELEICQRRMIDTEDAINLEHIKCPA